MRANCLIVQRSIILLIVSVIISCNNHDKKEIYNCDNVIPVPDTIVYKEGTALITPETKIQVQDSLQLNEIEWFVSLLNSSCNWQLEAVIDSSNQDNAIQLKHSDLIAAEGYELQIKGGCITISAGSSSGFFYGLQTLRQIVPAEVEGPYLKEKDGLILQNISVKDQPRFAWRGLMLDVSRHFFTVDEIKTLLDHMAMHKLNTFHWHLIDDQGWRIQIRKYPKLTEVGAWRADRDYKDWNNVEAQRKGEKSTYGGFYTQNDIKEVVEYATKLHIKVVPEIEMPAHVMSAIASYPHLSCTGDSISVPPGGVWPITNIYCPGKESTFEFIEDVLVEVMALFPSEYIHIGGDEATKTNWESCKHCQKRIGDKQLKNPEYLQAYMIERVEQFLNDHGRKLIGWDEILEGKLPARANVMSWRGVEGGIEAAQQGHDVIMSPNTHVYFDYYQGNPKYEPVAFNKNLPLEQVYRFDPVPDGFSSKAAKHVLGGQANVWTEYIPDNQQLQYMVFPRIAALSEAVWSQKKNRNWESFTRRLQHLSNRYDALGINFSKSMYQVSCNVDFDKDSNAVFLNLTTAVPGSKIQYAINNSDYTTYQKPVKINGSASIKAFSDRNKELIIERKIELNENDALGCKVTYTPNYSSAYTGGGNYGLVDGIRGSKLFGDGHWQGWIGTDIRLELDLGISKTVKNIEIGLLEDQGDQIFFPQKVEFYGSLDGVSYDLIGEVDHDFNKTDVVSVKEFNIESKENAYRYLKFVIQAEDKNLTQGNSWVFIDEIVVI